MDKKMFGFKSKTASVVLATGLAVGIMATPAFADSMSTDDYVTGAARRAAMPAPEILGISGVEESGTWLDASDMPNSYLNWSTPKYYLFGTAEYNENPNPYMYNLLNDYTGTSKKIAITDFVGSPNTTLPAYNSTGDDSWSTQVWNLLPDVIIGNQKNVDYTSAEYGGAAGAANGVESYKPIGVSYNMSTYSTLVNTMYSIAAAGDQAATNTGKQLRYGSATEIAKQYEEYILGTQGYVLSQLEAQGAQKKVVALITNYDASTGTYTLMESNVQDGTASTNRYLETVEAVSTQLSSIINTTTATSADLDKCDLIMFGSQRDGASEEDMLASLTADQKAKAYYTEGSNMGSLYGVTMNSVENAQNVGRILGCLYPEYVDQDDFVAYYFDNFYHVKSEKVADAVDNAMDGVVNWDSTGDRTNWTADDAATYVEADVQAKIDLGLAYLQSAGESAPKTLTPTDNLDSISYDIAEAAQDATCTIDYIPVQTYAGEAVTPNVTVRYNGSELVEGVEYDVKYLDNNAAGVATVVIEGKGAFTGSMSTTFRILASESQKSTFSDVTDGDWGKKAIEFCYTNGLITGYKDTNVFGTYDKLTRAQAAVILCRLFDPEAAETKDATDTTGKDDLQTPDYYTAAVNWAVENGIMRGYEGTNNFGPNDAMTREQLCAIVANAAEKFRGADIEGADTTKVNALPDASGIDDWAVQSMAWCVNNDVVKGVEDKATGVRYAKATETIDRSTMAGIMFNALKGEVF